MGEKQRQFRLKHWDKQTWGGSGAYTKGGTDGERKRERERERNRGERESVCLGSSHLFICSSLFGTHSPRVAVTPVLACRESKLYEWEFLCMCVCVCVCVCAHLYYNTMGLWLFVCVTVCVCVCLKLALHERSEVGVTQRMILGNLSCVSVAPQWRSRCRAVLSSSPDGWAGGPWGLNVSNRWTDSTSLKCAFTRWGVQCTWGEMRKCHKLTLMGCLVRRSGFWPLSLSFPQEKCSVQLYTWFLMFYLFMLVNLVMMYGSLGIVGAI